MTYRRSITIKEAAYVVMEAAYMKASANNTLPAKARQVMYAARGKIQDRTGKSLDDRYFTQTLLPDFIAENPELTAGWKVVFDARGHLIEPHTRFSIALGTLEVESYLRSIGNPCWSDPAASMPAIQTCGPSGRYGALLFCEKEGFNELFDEVQLGERYDIAIMSTKGVSVTAARGLVDEICARYEIPLFVLHDFDKSGFTILRTLQCDTRRYTFANKINVIDLGLRLADVEKHGLESESVEYRESARSIRNKPPKIKDAEWVSTVWSMPTVKPGTETQHPTSKPLDCFAIPMRQHARPGEVCYEPFSGSGSQIIAGEANGRRVFAMEISPVYVDVAVLRWQQATGQQAKLDGDGRTFDELADERLPQAA